MYLEEQSSRVLDRRELCSSAHGPSGSTNIIGKGRRNEGNRE